MSTSAKRKTFKTFLNTGTVGTPAWKLLGDGVGTAKVAYNGQLTDETFIHEDNATVDLDSLKANMPVKQQAKVGDNVFDYVDNLRITRATGSAARSEVVNVWLYKTPSGGAYPAERQTVTIVPDDFGGDGGKVAEMNYTIHYVGDPVLGTFNPTTLTFTPNP